MDINDVIAGAKLREHTVTLCLRGDLAAAHEQAVASLDALIRDGLSDSLAAPAVEAAKKIRELEDAMRESSTTFRFRALGDREYRALKSAHPGTDGAAFNVETYPVALIAASSADPVMTVPDVERLFEVLSEGQRDELFGGAFIVNEGKAGVPFNESASAVIRSYA